MQHLAVLFAFVALAACAPKAAVPIEQIPQLPTIKEVMRVQAKAADPQFKKIGAAFTDADFAEMSDAGQRIAATGLKTKDFAKEEAAGDPKFSELADKIAATGKALSDAAAAKDRQAASAALAEMRDTCRACHKQFK
jgi:hypothetical protein